MVSSFWLHGKRSAAIVRGGPVAKWVLLSLLRLFRTHGADARDVKPVRHRVNVSSTVLVVPLEGTGSVIVLHGANKKGFVLC